MKLIYVTIPLVIKDTKKAYLVSEKCPNADLDEQLAKDKLIFEEELWFSKPEKTPDGKSLKFHQLNDDWNE